MTSENNKAQLGAVVQELSNAQCYQLSKTINLKFMCPI